MRLRRRNRLAFAANRAAEHFLYIKRDDTALQRRILADSQRSGPGRLLAIDERTQLSPEAFAAEYVQTGTPVIMRGLAKDWPAVRTWSPSLLRERYGAQQLQVMDNDISGGIFNVEELTVAEFIDGIEGGDTRKYLRFGNLLHRFPELAGDFDRGVLDRYITKRKLGSNMGVFIGAKGTTTRLHAAPPDNLFAQVYGSKRWRVYGAAADPILRPLMARSTYYYTEYDPDHPDHGRFPAAKHLDWYEFELHPGDVLYNPPSFWHQVTNLGPTIGVGFRWLSPMAARLNPSQLLLFFLATNPPLWFVTRNKKNYTRVLQEAEKVNRTLAALRGAR